MVKTNKDFWKALDEHTKKSEIELDRSNGSAHPKYPDLIYPVDYGYLKETASIDSGGIDIWVGTELNKTSDAIICTGDNLKRDSEIKLLLGCSDEEKDKIYTHHNEKFMKGIMIKR